MPTYTYSCQSCGVQFEKFQKFADKPLTRCPECRTGRVKRLLQPPAIVFKGSGWYITDHRSSSGSAGKRSESEASSKESPSKAKGEGATETSKPTKKEVKETKAAKSET